MINAKQLTVVHKKKSSGSTQYGYVFKSEDGKFIFGALNEPVELNVGDVLKHYLNSLWETSEGNEIAFGNELYETTEKEASEKLADF